MIGGEKNGKKTDKNKYKYGDYHSGLSGYRLVAFT